MIKLIHRFTYYLLILLLPAINACNNVTDLQDPSVELIPETVISVLKDSVPGAENIVFKTVEQDKLWEATYERSSQSYYSALNRKKIIATYALHGNAVTDILKQATELVSIQNAQLSNFKEKERWGNTTLAQEFSSKYLFDNQTYLLTWNPAVSTFSHTYVMNLDIFSKFSFLTLDISDLPKSIQTFLDTRSLSHQGSKIFISDTNEKRYHIIGQGSGNTYEFIFDNNAGLIYSPYHLTDQYTTLASIPQFAQNFINSKKQLQGFSLVSGDHFEESGQTGYRFSVFKNSPYVESYVLYFNGSGDFNYLTYNAVANF